MSTQNKRSPSPAPPGPQPIIRLKESVINKIAAGEIIHRPASALKELIENSLDAGSTSIRVTVKDGGMRLLQIQDNGCGIQKSDLSILAERFTTSKLSTFSDLSRLTTYGFRGEALASISHVAHLTVITKIKADSCAWKACYQDGALISPKAGLAPHPIPCAGNDGTIITVEDLFYNTPTRLTALRTSTEEYARILDVVTKYAVHNPHVAFMCKKATSVAPDLSSPSSSTTAQTIGLLYGSHITKDLLDVNCSSKPKQGQDNDPESWSAEILLSSANYQAKKMVFLLFINHRLVESSRIKRSLESIYSGILPKGTSPFVYLSLQLDPRSVDVNVHPTKREVHFLNEDDIIEQITNAAQERLVGRSQSRVYEYHQTLLPGARSVGTEGKGKQRATEREHGTDSNTEQDETLNRASSSSSTVTGATKKKVASQHKVRTSAADRTLDSMFPVPNPARHATNDAETIGQSGGGGPSNTNQINKPIQLPDIIENDCFLASVQTLREAVNKNKHHGLTNILEKHVFVGIVDLDRCLTLIQQSTQLYLVNHGALAEELFYQLALRQFGDYTRLRLQPPPPLRTLVSLAVEAEEATARTKMTKSQITDRIVQTVMDRREMLLEYFCLSISDDGLVETLPLLLRDYTPNLDKLPLFLMRLGPQVDWMSETGCFETFLRELAYFYVPGPLDATSGIRTENDAEKAERWQIQHVVFPIIRKYLVAPKSLLDRDVVQIASLPDLYRVFERC